MIFFPNRLDKGTLLTPAYRFKKPIELLNSRVSELNDLRVEKLNRVKLVEKEKDELEGPMREALQCLHMENELTHKQNTICQLKMHNCKKEISENETKKNDIESSVSQLTEQLKEIHDKRKSAEKEISAKGAEFSAAQKKVEEHQNDFKKHELEDTNLKEDMKNTNVRRKKLKQLIELEKTKNEQLSTLPEENAEKITECQEQREKLEGRVVEEDKNYELAMTSLKAETQVFQDEREKHGGRLVGLRKGVDETQSVLTIAQNELNIYTSAEQKEKIRLDQLTKSIQSTAEQVAEKGSRLTELEELLPTKQDELADAQQEAGTAARRLEKVKGALQEVRMEFEEKRSSQAATKSHGKVHDALLQQKKNGNIPGSVKDPVFSSIFFFYKKKYMKRIFFITFKSKIWSGLPCAQKLLPISQNSPSRKL